MNQAESEVVQDSGQGSVLLGFELPDFGSEQNGRYRPNVPIAHSGYICDTALAPDDDGYICCTEVHFPHTASWQQVVQPDSMLPDW